MLFLSGFALGAISLLVIIIARDFGHLNVGRVFVAILVSGSFFLIQRHIPYPWNEIAASISTMVPALFWLLCQLAFAYRPKVVSITGFLACYTFAAPALDKILGLSQSNEIWHFLLWTLATYLEYIVIALGLWPVISHWQDDLVETSRTLRQAILVSVGVTVILVVVPMNTGLFTLDISYVVVAAAVLVCSYFLIEGKNGVLFGAQHSFMDTPIASNIEPIKDTQEVIEDEYQIKLKSLMADGFYRTEHLALKTLAQALELPEYKTRALINQTLGYRNFNDYINQLRIQEAAQRLSNEPDTPILNISLDVGYRTLSSFNRAFKDIQNTTPTEYRQSQS